MGCSPTYLILLSVDAVKQALVSFKGDKIAWVHHERPNFCKSMYVVLKILDKEHPLPQMWVETRREYRHQHLEWCSRYSSSCLALARTIMVTNYLHLNVWKDILKISSRPLIQVERAFLVDSSFIN